MEIPPRCGILIEARALKPGACGIVCVHERCGNPLRLGRGGNDVIEDCLLRNADGDDGTQEMTEPGVQSLRSTTTGLRVLIVDDMRPLLMILQNGLTKMGYTVSAALSGPEALKIFHEAPVDAVISDLAMEGLTGLEVAQAIRDLCNASSIPRPVFVLLTGWGFEVENNALLPEFGVDVVFTKPVEIPELVETLERLTRARGQQREVAG